VFRCVPLPAEPTFTLSGPEGRHAATVRRLRPGERLDVTDGAGGGLACEVVRVRRDAVDCRVVARRSEPAPVPRIVLVQALAKGDRGERAVEMLTEVGVDEIVPWSAARAVVRWEGERGERARERWRVIAAEAAKQSRRLRWPSVADLAGTADVAARVARVATAGLAVVLHEDGGMPLAGLVRSPAGRRPPPEEILLVVGPEGGITADELAAFRAAGGTVARLGPTVLRTSTAGVVAAAVVLADTRRWGG
jgi:16S rRNA (uracil1498-N3)-methyltransferase